MVPDKSTSRLAAQDWVDAALEAATEGGLGAVAVEPLARRLGATKGSFYWHFADRSALLIAVLDAWLARTDRLIAQLSPITDPQVRLETLFGLVYEDETWAGLETDLLGRMGDPAVADVVEHATVRRVTFMADCLRGMGLSDEAATDGALQGYALWIGVLQLTTAVPATLPTPADRRRFEAATLVLLRNLYPGD